MEIHFLMFGIWICRILLIRLCLGNVSKALLMSIAISIVFCVGFEFRAFIIGWVIMTSVVVVGWFLYLCWKPCLGSIVGISINFSRVWRL